MDLFKRKKKEDALSEEKLLQEIEKETASLKPFDTGGMPPMPSAPGAKGMPALPSQPPAPIPAPRPALAEEQVAKLPLFMKVEEYDRIVNDLNVVVNSMKSMEDTLQKLTQLEHEETDETQRWREQLDIAKTQISKLLADMPETGRLRNLVDTKKKGKQREQIKKNISGLKKELEKSKIPKKEVDTKVGKDIQELRDSIKGTQGELNHLHLELKMLNSLTQLRSSKMVQDIKETAKTAAQPQPQPKPAKPEYKKSDTKKPW